RAEIMQSFWDDLCRNIRQKRPNLWNFHKQRVECGWSCDRHILGTQRTVIIAFGFMQDDSSFSESSWPIMNSWTGIQVVFHSAASGKEMLHAVRQLSIRTEPPDSGWVVWEFWTSLANTNIEGLYERLTGSGRAEAQQEIID